MRLFTVKNNAIIMLRRYYSFSKIQINPGRKPRSHKKGVLVVGLPSSRLTLKQAELKNNGLDQ